LNLEGTECTECIDNHAWFEPPVRNCMPCSYIDSNAEECEHDKTITLCEIPMLVEG